MNERAQRQRRAGQTTAAPEAVVFYANTMSAEVPRHQWATWQWIARCVAHLRDSAFLGRFDGGTHHAGPLYYVPADTIGSLAQARELGIGGSDRLFGGVVPYPFVATKAITHSLPGERSLAPAGWSREFGRLVESVVLPGVTVFDADEARHAGAALLRDGGIRLKLASGIGGSGQTVVNSLRELDAALGALDADNLARDGLVIERNLEQVSTLSIGQVRIGELEASYFGTQWQTTDRRGNSVYGGSDITVVRGGYDALPAFATQPQMRLAIDQARVYHEAAMRSFPGMFVSRCNYDVVQGVDDQGRHHSGVLEQSWRIGGATPAEIIALQAFIADPALRKVRSAVVETHEPDPLVPDDAQIFYCGTDDKHGMITKYTRLVSADEPVGAAEALAQS